MTGNSNNQGGNQGGSQNFGQQGQSGTGGQPLQSEEQNRQRQQEGQQAGQRSDQAGQQSGSQQAGQQEGGSSWSEEGMNQSGGPLDHNRDQRDDEQRARQMEQQADVDYKQRAGDGTSQQGRGAGRSDKA